MTAETVLMDRTLITKNYLGSVITCMDDKGYDIDDFEISTERVQGYSGGYPAPKSIIYVHRKSTGIEKNYVLDGNPSFSDALCIDLHKRIFDTSSIL